MEAVRIVPGRIEKSLVFPQPNAECSGMLSPLAQPLAVSGICTVGSEFSRPCSSKNMEILGEVCMGIGFSIKLSMSAWYCLQIRRRARSHPTLIQRTIANLSNSKAALAGFRRTIP